MSDITLGDGEWELDNFLFGGPGSPFEVAPATDIGGFDLEQDDVGLPGAPGVIPTESTFRSATWTFEIYTKARTPAVALDAIRNFSAAWRKSATAKTAQVSTLRHSFAGRTTLVYGRARRISSPRTDSETRQGHAAVTAQFTVTDPIVYSDVESSLALELVQATDGGAVWPVTWPVTWGSSSIARQGIVYVEGDASVPFSITVNGPVTGQCSDITVTGPGWAIDVPGPLAFDEQLIIDTRAMTATIGGHHGIVMSRRTRLTARLQPGPSEITFSCTDATLTARATIAWRSGWYSL